MTQPQLRVEADLRLEVDGVHAQVVGRGQELTVTTDRPLHLLRAAATGSAGYSFAATRRLRELGFSVTLRGPNGPLVVAGARGGSGRFGLPPVRVVGVPPAVRSTAVALVALVVVTVLGRRARG